MKLKVMAKTVAYLTALLGWKDLPIDAENQEIKLTAEERAKVEEALGKKMSDEALNGINSEIKAMQDSNHQIKAIQDEIDALVAESNLTAEELARIEKDGNGNPDTVATIKAIGDNQKNLEKKQKELEATLAKLITDPEEDTPSAIIKNLNKDNLKHSATHLFGSGKSYDAFEKRAWNARLRDGGVKATDFNQNGNIPLLQGDLEHFVNDNPGVLNSLFNDFAELPAEWDRKTGVLDKVSDGYIIPGEIVQGRAKGWSPKNDYKIASEEGKVYRKKIDITFTGYQLQQIENTWIRNYNKEKSHPWKMSFIGFLLGELVKQQKLDDRKAQINGIYVESPGGDDKPGAAVNSQNGLLYLWYFHRDVKKNYKAFDIGVPTDANIVDYINLMIELIPEEDRKEEGMEIELSSKWLKAYKKRAGILYQHNFNTDSGEYEYKENYPIDYPNYKFQELRDMTKTDFIGITKSKNVQILDYDVSEKGKFTVTHEKRDTHIFADYRLGIRLIFVGTKLAEGDPRQYEVQKVWSNNVPVFATEVTAPAFDDTSGILKLTYPNITVENDWKTNIVDIEGAVKNSVVRITGNKKLPAAKNVTSNAKLLLTANFDLSTGGTLTLFVQEDGKFKELSRTAEPAVAPSTDVQFDEAVLDANEGSVFRMNGIADVAITNIINGVENKTIKIFGTDAAGIEVTLSTTGNIKVTANASLGKATDYIQLTRVDGVWIETAKSIIP